MISAWSPRYADQRQPSCTAGQHRRDRAAVRDVLLRATAPSLHPRADGRPAADRQAKAASVACRFDGLVARSAPHLPTGCRVRIRAAREARTGSLRRTPGAAAFERGWDHHVACVHAACRLARARRDHERGGSELLRGRGPCARCTSRLSRGHRLLRQDSIGRDEARSTDVSFSIKRVARCWALVGEIGFGQERRPAAWRCCGMLEPTAGSVRFDGHRPAPPSDKRRDACDPPAHADRLPGSVLLAQPAS